MTCGQERFTLSTAFIWLIVTFLVAFVAGGIRPCDIGIGNCYDSVSRNTILGGGNRDPDGLYILGSSKNGNGQSGGVGHTRIFNILTQLNGIPNNLTGGNDTVSFKTQSLFQKNEKKKKKSNYSHNFNDILIFLFFL